LWKALYDTISDLLGLESSRTVPMSDIMTEGFTLETDGSNTFIRRI
jgi:hypothetical protein